MTTAIICGVVLIGILMGAARMFIAWNAPKVEVENTKQEQEDTKQTTVKSETREDIVKARLSVRLMRIFLRRGGNPANLPPALDPKPNRPL